MASASTGRSATEKLYWSRQDDTAFVSTVMQHVERNGRVAVVLEGTLFYPDSGGQHADSGYLHIAGKSLAVDEVEIGDDGVIYHYVAGVTLEQLRDIAVGTDVRGDIDLARRMDHTAQHSAQHLLSQAFARRGFRTVSSRLGHALCTIDLEAEVATQKLGPDDALRAAESVYEWVLRDIEVQVLYPDAAELESLGLRKQPTVAEGIRVISIPGVDATPCGGTHVRRTGEVGYPLIESHERYKRGYRITFHAGARAMRRVVRYQTALAELEKTFTCGIDSLGAAANRALQDRRLQSKQLEIAERGHAQATAELLATRSVHAGAPGATWAVWARSGSTGYVRELGAALHGRGARLVVVLGGWDAASASAPILISTSGASGLDCAALLEHLAAALGEVRGGGRANRAEGRLTAEPSAALLDAARASVRAYLSMHAPGDAAELHVVVV
jgi:alanyl-tRNA synthetase